MDDIDQFAVWNEEGKTITFQLVEGTPIGLFRAEVTLDDTRLTKKYQLYVHVSAAKSDGEAEEESGD